MLDTVSDGQTLVQTAAVGAPPSTGEAAPESKLALRELAPVWCTELHAFATPTPDEEQAFEAQFGLPLPQPRQAVLGNGKAILSAGPQRWYLFGGADLGAAPASLWPEGTGALIRQAQGRVLFALSGEGARSLLAKGTSIDLHPQVFAVGACAATALAGVGVTLARTGEDDYLLCVPRSYARWLWDWILLSSRELKPHILPSQPLP